MDWQDRRRLIGTRLTIGLTMLVAILSIITGIVNIGTTAVYGPFAEFIPGYISRTAGFTGAMTGFVMMVSAIGLRRGLKVAWWSALLLLPLTAIQGLVQSSPFSIPLVFLSILTIPNLIANRKRFTKEITLSNTQIAAALALIGAQLYGTIGTYAMRNEFTGVDTLLDAFYYTIVTASTVGYGDITPVSQEARLFGMSVLIVGTASFAIALGALLGPAIEARVSAALGKMTTTELESLENHVLVLGFGELTEPILHELTDKTDYVVISPDNTAIARFRERKIYALQADPSDEEPLKLAGLDRAMAVVVATNNDAEDAFTVLTVRKLRPDVRIVAAATDLGNIEKLKRAGADMVISPAAIGGRLLVQSALGREDTESIADRLK